MITFGIEKDKRRNQFRVRIRENGIRRWDCYYWDTRNEAKQRGRVLENQDRNNALGLHKEITFRDAFEIFLKHTLPRLANDLQREHCEVYVKQIVTSFGDLKLNQTSYQHIVDYWESFIRRGCKPSTANRSIMWIHSLYERMRVWNAMVPEMMPEKVALPEVNPVKVAKESLGRKRSELPFMRSRVLSDEEIRNARSWCQEKSPELWPAIQMAMLTMLRKGDLLKLKANAPIAGIQEKTQRPFFVPLIMEKSIALSEREIRSRWDHLRSDLGWRIRGTPQHVTWHDLRHCGPTLLAEMGIERPIIQALLGHSTEKQSATYINIRDHVLRPAIAALQERLEAV